jgi:hypothetical protein
MTAEPTTHRNSPLSSGDLKSTPSEHGTARKVSTLHRGLQWELATFRNWLEGATSRSRAYWIPPRFLTKPPASIAEMTAYAHRAGWTSQTTGLARKLGVVWFYVVAIPAAVVTRYVGWMTERPGRSLLAFGLWQLLIRTGGGPWIAEHLIDPLLAAAAWIFLP